jgi:anti-anti-sigma factor
MTDQLSRPQASLPVPAQGIDVRVEHVDSTTYARLRGEFDLATMPHAWPRLEREARRGPDRLVVELDGLAYATVSSMAHVLVRLEKLVAGQGTEVVVRLGPSRLRHLLDTVGVGHLLEDLDSPGRPGRSGAPSG